MSRRCIALIAAALLTGCAAKPAVPDWSLNARGATDRATAASLNGNSRLAEQEWARARAEVARTGRPDLLARVELLRCAAQTANLEPHACAAFDALRADAAAPERTYADYLAGRSDAPITALPLSQQAMAGRSGAAAESALAGMADPLSRLVAAGVLLRRGEANAAVAAMAVDTASAQGWRRPLLAWLLWSAERAEQAGDTATAQALRRRIAVVQGQGALTP